MMATNESSADEFEHLFSQSDGIGVATSKKGKTSVLQTSNSTGRLPTSKTLPAGPGKLTKVTAAFNKPNSKSVFNTLINLKNEEIFQFQNVCADNM